jgi:hypothetical protein
MKAVAVLFLLLKTLSPLLVGTARRQLVGIEKSHYKHYRQKLAFRVN